MEITRICVIKDVYRLQFCKFEDNRAGRQTFLRHNLKWADLATHYDQRRAELVAVRVVARIKRARLE